MQSHPVGITFERVEKRFGPLAALRGVSLEIRAGEFVALLGPNGAGKTTLLRIAALLAVPTRGNVRFSGARDGSDSESGDAKWSIGMVGHRTAALRRTHRCGKSHVLRPTVCPGERRAKTRFSFGGVRARNSRRQHCAHIFSRNEAAAGDRAARFCTHPAFCFLTSLLQDWIARGCSGSAGGSNASAPRERRSS